MGLIDRVIKNIVVIVRHVLINEKLNGIGKNEHLLIHKEIFALNVEILVLMY